jgi:hypothetical protein
MMTRLRVWRKSEALVAAVQSVLLAIVVCCSPGLYAQTAPAGEEPTNQAQADQIPDAQPPAEKKPAVDCSNSPDNIAHGYPASCHVASLVRRTGADFVALDGAGVVSTADTSRNVIVGFTVLGGYDSAFTGSPGTAASFNGQSGYASFYSARRSGYFVLQNSASIVSYSISGGLREYFDRAQLSAGGVLNGRWSWDADAANGVGNDALQVVLPLNTAGQNNIDVPSPDAPAYSIHAGQVLDNDVSFSLTNNTSRRQSWRYQLRNSYRNLFDQKTSDDTLHARSEYDVKLSPETEMGMFGEIAHERGTIVCTTATLGLSYRRQVMHRSALQLSGGPSVGTTGCVVTVTGNFYGAFTSELASGTTVYASGSRDLNQSLVGRATWMDTVQGGVAQRLGLNTEVRVDTGYLRATQPTQTQSFQGAFVGGSLQRALPGGLTLDFSLRRFNYSGTGTSLTDRTQAIASIGWSSNRHKARSRDEVTVQ